MTVSTKLSLSVSVPHKRWHLVSACPASSLLERERGRLIRVQFTSRSVASFFKKWQIAALKECRFPAEVSGRKWFPVENHDDVIRSWMSVSPWTRKRMALRVAAGWELAGWQNRGEKCIGGGGWKTTKKTINLVTPPQLYCPERRTFLRFWRSWHGNMCCEDTASWFLVMMVMIFHVTVLFWKAFCRAECSQTASRVLRNLCHTRVLQLIIAQGTVTQHRLKVIKGNRVYFLSPVF